MGPTLKKSMAIIPPALSQNTHTPISHHSSCTTIYVAKFLPVNLFDACFITLKLCNPTLDLDLNYLFY